MNAEIKQRWVEALRSGDYQQGKQQLKTIDGKFCCLGVLTDLYLKDHNKGWNDIGYRAFSSPIVKKYSELGVLPSEVQEWAGCGGKSTVYDSLSLTYMNDVDGCSFNDIATYIEGHDGH